MFKAWDDAESRLYDLNTKEWHTVDRAADGAIESLRAGHPDAAKAKAAVTALIASLDNPDAR